MESTASAVALAFPEDSSSSETDISALQSPLPSYVSSRNPESIQEEAKDVYIALDVKEESQLSLCILEEDDGRSEKENQNTDSYKASQAKHVEEKEERECRVCHLVFDNPEPAAGETMELGCDCKDDLSLAHRNCAEAWFKIKGNRTCEICGAVAQNVVGMEDTRLTDDRDAGSSSIREAERCWHSQPLCNFILACMVMALILPWMFRVSIF